MVSDDIKSIGILVSLKLILQPAVTAFLAFYVFSMPPLWSHSAVILSALPIGSGPFTIAKLYGLEAGVTSGCDPGFAYFRRLDGFTARRMAGAI